MAGQPQGSPGELDQPRDRSPKQRENTPQAPGGKEEDQTAKQDGQEKKPEPGQGEKPESPEENPLVGQNEVGKDPNNKRGDAVPASLDAQRWGELPTRVRETFRNQGRSELPAQYRDWIDAYYRRLSQKR